MWKWSTSWLERERERERERKGRRMNDYLLCVQEVVLLVQLED